MVDHQTTRQQDNETRDDAVARRGQPPSFDYGVPGWSVVPPTRSYGAAGSGQWSSRQRAFTLVELLVSMVVLVILVFLATQLVNSAATVTILGHKRMDADSQARQVFDRMAVDFAQMMKRPDVDYYYSTGLQNGTLRNDQMAFYSAVPGYYSSSSSSQQSPLSLVAYRVNSDPNSASYNKLERLGKGLVWNGVPPPDTPIVFLPLTISSTWCQAAISGTPSATCTGTPDPNYEVIGPDVFRFECYFLLGGQLSVSPCQVAPCADGFKQVTAIVVDLAVIDSRSKVLLQPQDIASFNTCPSGGFNSCFSNATNFLVDFTSDKNHPGIVVNDWRTKLDAIQTLPSGMSPRQTVPGIRVYERYFYLNH